jgi:tRNA (guanine-N7-)-methyltransferase
LKNKRERFRIIAGRENVVEPGKEIYERIKGKWGKDYFRNDNPITVELACGRGEYTVGLAGLFPARNYLGIDIKGDRIWKGSTIALERGLTNVGFLRTLISHLESFFVPGEIDELWITFPDPRPKKRDVKRRLTSPGFLAIFNRLLKPGGFVRLKTDNAGLFEYSLEQLSMRTDIADLRYTDDLYSSDLRPECFDIKTRYELMFANKGEKIKYLRFRFVNSD